MAINNKWEPFNIGKETTLKARIGWQGLTVEEYKDIGNFYLVTGTDFENGFVNWDTCHFVDKWRYTQDRNIQLKNGDVLVTKDGTIGKIGYVDNLKLPTTLNSGVFVVRAIGSKLYQKFLYYIFTSNIFDDFLTRLTAGSTINHLYQKDFVHFEFQVPELEEQKAIATALSNTDELINSLEKLISKKEAIKIATIQQLLTPNNEWKVNKLGEIATFHKGKGLPKSHLKENGKFKCIHYGELFTKYKEQIRNILSFTDEDENAFYSISNDVLMPTSDVTPNGLATASCIEENGVTLGGDILVIRCPKNILNGIYLSYYISKNREQVMKLVSGSTVYHLYGSDMKELEIKFPSPDEQTTIAEILTDMDKELEKLKLKLSKIKAIKEGMMQELLTGKTRLVS